MTTKRNVEIMRTDNNTMNIIPVHDEAIEKAVLGTLLKNKDAVNECRDILDENCFYNPINKRIFNAIKEIDENGEIPSILNVSPLLSEGKDKINISYILDIDNNNIFYDCYQYAIKLSELAEKRKMYAMGYYVMQLCSDDRSDVNDIISKLRKDIESIAEKKPNQFIKIDTSLKNLCDRVNNNLSNEKAVIGTPTGFSRIDANGGLIGGNLLIIGAETSQGKTSFALSITFNAINQGGKVAYYSMEMQHPELTARLVAMATNLSSSSILYNKLDDTQLKMFDNGINRLIDKNLYYDDRSSSNIDVILTSIRNMKIKYDIDGAVVDYLQILSVNRINKNSTDEQLMGDVSRRLKNLAKELNIWIIALSQLNRNQDNPIPTLARLRTSGQIGEAADIVLLIYRPEVYNKRFPEPFCNRDTHGTAMIDIAKGRNVGLCKFLCRFDAKTTHFYEDDTIGNYEQPKSDDAPF